MCKGMQFGGNLPFLNFQRTVPIFFVLNDTLKGKLSVKVSGVAKNLKMKKYSQVLFMILFWSLLFYLCNLKALWGK